MKEYIERYSSALKTAWWAFVGIIIMLFCAAALSGCTTTKYVEIEKIRTDTTYITKLQRDSIHVHDSIFVNQWKKGDTVYQVRDRWHTEWRDRLLHDTLYKCILDSIPIPYPVEKIVEKPVTPWYNYILIGGLALALLYFIFKRIIG